MLSGPAPLQGVGLLRRQPLLGLQHARRERTRPEQAGAELLGREPEADRVARLPDRRQATDAVIAEAGEMDDAPALAVDNSLTIVDDVDLVAIGGRATDLHPRRMYRPQPTLAPDLVEAH